MCCYLLGQFRVYNRSSVARNWGELRATVIELHGIVGIARNCAELRGIARSLQGSQLRASKIHLRQKPQTQLMTNFTKILILPSLGRNQHHWSTFGDPNSHLIADSQILQTPSFSSESQILIGDPKLFIGDPRFSLETPDVEWTPQAFI